MSYSRSNSSRREEAELAGDNLSEYPACLLLSRTNTSDDRIIIRSPRSGRHKVAQLISHIHTCMSLLFPCRMHGPHEISMTLVSSFSSPTMASRSGTADLARVSCFHCRNSKRRCDKTLPACALCCRRGVECRYPRRRGQRSASPQDISNLQDEATSAGSAPALVQAGPTTPSTPSTAFAVSTAIRFLAPDLFGELRLQIPRLEWDVPADVAFQLGDQQQIHDVTVTFLRMTRPWMPVVSGKRHLAAVLSPLLTPLRRPRALLALCMKLCCLSVEDRSRNGERHPLYLLVKQFYAEVERVEEPCLEVMQAALFIAVFEMGDAIYPAAYLTVGAMIRYGLSMGMDKINVERMGVITGTFTGAPWQDIEEMKRVWWGALILDRCVNCDCCALAITTMLRPLCDFAVLTSMR